jgi:hypothetical protein
MHSEAQLIYETYRQRIIESPDKMYLHDDVWGDEEIVPLVADAGY